MDMFDLEHFIHIEDGSSLYKNGTWRHSGANKKEYHINKEQRKFLEDNGWTVPKQN